jgi:hypothetical protein
MLAFWIDPAAEGFKTACQRLVLSPPEIRLAMSWKATVVGVARNISPAMKAMLYRPLKRLLRP